MNKQKLAVLILASLGVISAFLPWFSSPFIGSISGISGGYGAFTLIFFIVPILLCVIGDRSKRMKSGALIASSIFAVLALAVALVYFAAVSKTTPLNIGAIGVGTYLTLITGICLPEAGLVIKD